MQHDSHPHKRFRGIHMDATRFGVGLAEAFRAAGTPMTDATENAFKSVDRLTFVEGFFDRQGRCGHG